MRRTLVMVLVLLLPVVQGINITVPNPTHYGEEAILESSENVWSQAMWSELSENGFTPLRMLSPNHVLVWKSINAEVSAEFTSLQSPRAEYLSSLEPYDGMGLRFVFEPRLPPEAVESLEWAFAALGLEINDDLGLYSNSLPHVEEIIWPHNTHLPSDFAKIDGLLWMEPLLTTKGRNGQAGSLHQHGYTTENPAWALGLNGKGVTVAAADSGIDLDHACFRNATAAGAFGSEEMNGSDGVVAPGSMHRKMVLVNQSIDSSDTPGHSDYRHGTHVAGTLACHSIYDMREQTMPMNGSALSYESRLLFQDIVSAEGWVPPDVDELLYEAAKNGAVIHSDSWGDDTTAYTARTGDFDAWSREMPWSLSFIAPGNNAGQLLEPANGRNVAAIGAAVKSENSQRWSASSYGPTEAQTNGIFALAVGSNIQSARADGLADSYNDALRSSSGTSMATPAAAGTAALIQQMVEQGWISGSELRTPVGIETVRPSWASEEMNATNHLLLSEGFTPSGPMLRSLLSLATTPLSQSERNNGLGGFDLQNPYDGWGILNLSELIDFQKIEAAVVVGNHSPADSIWIHDSYRLLGQTPAQWLSMRQGNLQPLENLLANPWNGSGAIGPFLHSGDSWIQRLSLDDSGTFDARLSFSASQEPHLVDDLQFIVHLPNGRSAISSTFSNDGGSTLFYTSSADFSNATAHPPSNETIHAIRLNADDLEGIEWVDVEVRARYVSPGNQNGSVGVDGNRIGFAVAVKGVDRDSDAWDDGDGDGVANALDACPSENATDWDVDQDGCFDDTDGDGVVDIADDCPNQNATQYDLDSNGCIDDSDTDGIFDNFDLCFTVEVSISWPVDTTGCRPMDTLPSVDLLLMPENGSEWYDALNVRWSATDLQGDIVDTGASIWAINASHPANSFSVTSCEYAGVQSGNYSCIWYIPSDLPVADIRNLPLQIEVYVQSKNESPEAKNELVIVRDGAVFTSNWNSEYLNDVNTADTFSESAGQNRGLLLFLAMLGVVTGFATMAQLKRAIRYEESDNFVPSAFTQDGSIWFDEVTSENE